ncbi:hypothetical protein, partial [Streptomyces sp. UNOC14_S4]|uniref:hypothetical protein n=1 Tax=Streptomyces sp. UNOC14_S4 TaxID=2872340 RepID=UPI001E5566C0
RLPTGRTLLVEAHGPMPAPMKRHLTGRCDAHHADLAHLTAQGPPPGCDAVICYLGGTADLFLFDRDLYWSECAETSRRIMEEHGLPVYWIDGRGDVTPARDVLYVHHTSFRCAVPSTYARYWA